MATKCVPQMPAPATEPAATSHINRKRPLAARARATVFIAVKQANRHNSAATATKRKSCCWVMQPMTLNMEANLARGE